MVTTVSPLHPVQEPFAIHHLHVGQGHTLYVEESGNPQGLPALFIHGGPGSGTSPDHRGYFNPAVYRIVLFDQRGCGQSTAADPLAHNTTQHLLADIEAIRTHLGIAQWHTVAGWSWGSTLALLYAQSHPHLTKSLVLSSVFLADDATIAWSFGPHGAAQLFPEAYNAVASLLGHPSNLPAALHAAFTGPDHAFAQTLALKWMFFDALTMEATPDPAAIQQYLSEHAESILPNARLMLHYISQRCFLPDGHIINHAAKLAHLPIWLSHGVEDHCCPLTGALLVQTSLPQVTFHPVAGAGHRSTDALKSQRISHLDAAATLP